MLRSIEHISCGGIPGALAVATAVLAGGCEKPEEKRRPTTITVTPATVTMPDIMLTEQLSATVEDENGQVMPDVDIDWRISNDDIAKVDRHGLVTAKDEGQATVWALTGRLLGSAKITVTLGPRAHLGKFYEATGGSGSAWTNDTNWGTDKPVNEWYGVETDADGNVTGLRLSNNGLSGVLPPEIKRLAHLETLALDSNGGLGGPIPREIGELVNLKSFTITRSAFVGKIPREIGNLVNLELFIVQQDFQISPGKLSGSIPPEFGNLVNLEEVDLNGNAIGGSLPPELGNLASLRRLELNANGLSGSIPPEFGKLGNLAELVIANMPSMSGPLPGELTAVPLSTFEWQGTQLCAPTDDAFQEWLRSIDDHSGSGNCDDT